MMPGIVVALKTQSQKNKEAYFAYWFWKQFAYVEFQKTLLALAKTV